MVDTEQAKHNIQVTIDGGCPGVYLINHDFEKEKLIPIIRDVRSLFPAYWIGVNFLAVTGKHAFTILGKLQDEGILVDSYWADDARIDKPVPKMTKWKHLKSVTFALKADGTGCMLAAPHSNNSATWTWHTIAIALAWPASTWMWF